MSQNKLIERFLKYVKIDTQSDGETGLTPSTPGQMIFAEELVEELKEIGLTEVLEELFIFFLQQF